MRTFFSIPAFMTVLFVSLLSSCIDTKKAAYFYDQPDSSIPSSTTIPQNIIQPNDLLSINVSSLNPQATAIFNTPNASASQSTNSGNDIVSQTVGYLVNSEGNIQFPVLGSIKAGGLTTNQLREGLTDSLQSKKLLIGAIVSIRHINFKVSVLGEVSRPAVINVPSEKISLLEALGFAGDITINGKKNNVMIIREESGKRTIKRLNLNSGEIFSSPYYYLKSNDIVYVEPDKAKIASTGRVNQLLPIILSALSFAAIIVTQTSR